ncbi:hypothetical protein ABZ667_31425 [Streptomyces lavendulae]|uniref:hypothetical protein n=1 Tax=Streptomyces lavendulae TaxID=1914 RepID=UPI0034041817
MTRAPTPTRERFRQVVSAALPAEELVTGRFGHTVLHLQAEPGGLGEAEHRASLELFQSQVAPVLRRSIPDPAFPPPPGA